MNIYPSPSTPSNKPLRENNFINFSNLSSNLELINPSLNDKNSSPVLKEPALINKFSKPNSLNDFTNPLPTLNDRISLSNLNPLERKMEEPLQVTPYGTITLLPQINDYEEDMFRITNQVRLLLNYIVPSRRC